MNLSKTLKTLPLIGALAMGLALTPAISNADDDKRGRDKDRYSHDAGKSHKKAHKQAHRAHKKEWKREHVRDHRRDHRDYRKKHGHKHVNSHKHGWKKRHGKHYGHRHTHHGHRHGHRGHRHEHVVVRDYDYHDHYVDFDDLRFMIGLHTDNVDIIFRD